MGSKFTPGPWEAHGDGIRTAAEPGWLIATMGSTFHDNRPLIAEAPAMLEALRSIGAEITAWDDEENPNGAQSPNELAARIAREVRAILARIDGEG